MTEGLFAYITSSNAAHVAENEWRVFQIVMFSNSFSASSGQHAVIVTERKRTFKARLETLFLSIPAFYRNIKIWAIGSVNGGLSKLTH